MPAVPLKLRPGSVVRVIAPSRSLAIIGPEVRAEADRKLAALGLRVSFGEHVSDCDDFSSSSVRARLADLHAAFADPGVDGILSVIGGFSSNQLLTGIDFGLVAAHPKVLCGFSDITVLSNALYARAGLVGYSGPHYSSFGMKRHFEFTEAGFRACLMDDAPVELTRAAVEDEPGSWTRRAAPGARGGLVDPSGGQGCGPDRGRQPAASTCCKALRSCRRCPARWSSPRTTRR